MRWFEGGYDALKPDMRVIAPCREWDLTSRTRLRKSTEQNQIPIARTRGGPWGSREEADLAG